MKKEKLDFNFPMDVAHGVHSLTLNEIRFFFNPSAGEDNGIPVVNPNRTQSNSVLPNAPLIVLNNSLTATPALWGIDYVLSHMDDDNYGIKVLNTLDSIAHRLHIQEWNIKAAVEYKKIKKDAPTTPGFCTC